MSNKTKVEGCSTSSLDLLIQPYIINQVIQEIYKSGDLDKLHDDDYIKARVDEKLSVMIHGVMTAFDYEQNRKMLESLNDDLRKKHNLDFKINKDIFKQYIVKTVTENKNDFVKFAQKTNSLMKRE